MVTLNSREIGHDPFGRRPAASFPVAPQSVSEVSLNCISAVSRSDQSSA